MSEKMEQRNTLRDKVDKVLNLKVEEYEIKCKVQQETLELIHDLADSRRLEFLSINWSRLTRLTGTEPLRSRIINGRR